MKSVPFSKENRRFTLSLIAIVVIALTALISFSYLSHADKERTYLYGTVIGMLVPVLCLQVMNLQKTTKVNETVQQGQFQAVERNRDVKAEIRDVKQTLAQTDGMPRTLDELRDVVLPIIRAEMPAMAKAVVAELRANNWQPPAP